MLVCYSFFIISWVLFFLLFVTVFFIIISELFLFLYLPPPFFLVVLDHANASGLSLEYKGHISLFSIKVEMTPERFCTIN